MNPSTHILSNPPATETLARLRTTPQPAPRILVLVPHLELDLTEAARKVWELARASGAQVQFVSLYSNPAEESALRRTLATLASLVQDANVSVGLEVFPGRNWLEVVNTQPADMIVCFPEKNGHALQNQLARLNPPIPLYIFSAPEKDAPPSNIPNRIAAWAGSLIILVSFFFIQAQLTQLAPNWLQSLLMILSTLVEFGAIWSLNSSL